MKLKNLIFSTILILETNFFVFNFVNSKNENITNLSINPKSINPEIISIENASDFYGFSLKVNIPEIADNYVKKISIKYHTDIDVNWYPYIDFNFDIEDEFKGGNNLTINLLSEISSDFYSQWMGELNYGFQSTSSSNAHLSSFNNYFFDFYVEYYYHGAVSNSSNSSSSIKLDNSNQNSYTRAQIDHINSTIINDPNDLYNGWFENEIILTNKYSDSILEKNFSIYNETQKYDSSNLVLNFDSDLNIFKFYLKPYKLGENTFLLNAELKYSLYNVDDIFINDYSWVAINQEYNEPKITTEVIKLDRLYGNQNFNFNYSLEIDNTLIIDKIYIAKSSQLDHPYLIDPNYFTLNSSGNQTISFNILNSSFDEIYYNDLVLVVKTIDIYNNYHTTTKTIDSFSVDPIKDISINFDIIDQTRTSVTFNYDINLGDQRKINKLTIQPVNEKNPDYNGEYQLNPIEFIFDDSTPLKGIFKIENLPSSTKIPLNPWFKLIIDYQTFDNNNSKYVTQEFEAVRKEGYKSANLPSDTIESINVNHNKAKINWKINKTYLGDDQLEKVVLKGNNQIFELTTFQFDDKYIFGSFIIDELEYRKNYTYTLTYTVLTYIIDGELNGHLHDLDDEIVSFKSGFKNYTKVIFSWFIIDTTASLLTLLNFVLIIKNLSNKKDDDF